MLDLSLVEKLGQSLFDALSQKGFETLTPVQQAILASEHAGRDLRISSKTGSGKTVAMGLLVRDLLEGCDAGPRVLVITPTRELAKQVEEELAWLFAPMKAGVASVTGGSGGMGYRQERRALSLKPAIVVGTPGRILDHLDRGVLIGENLAAVMLDEADRMLDLGFRDDIEAILKKAPTTRRTHLVSATFPPEVRALADSIQTNPVRIEGTPLGSANEDIDHLVHLIVPEQRLSAIINLLLTTPSDPVLIFAKTRTDVSQLTADLRDAGFMIGKLSGEMDQTDRNRALAAFRRGQLDAMVATDVAARGIDVQGIARVIHTEPPMDPDAYIHRSGRTGRAGNKGLSSMLVSQGNLMKAERLLARARVNFRFEPIPTAADIRTRRDERFLALLTADSPVDPQAGEISSPAQKAHLRTLAERILKLDNALQAVTNLLEKARASGPTEPKEITAITPPEKRAGRGPEGRERRPREDRAPRDNNQTFDLFRIAWGQEHGADARRLVAMVCRRGNIESRSIGAIRVQRTFSTVEIETSAAPAFEERAAMPDPRDPRVTIRRFTAKRPEEDRPKSDGSAAEAPRLDAPAPGRDVERDGPPRGEGFRPNPKPGFPRREFPGRPPFRPEGQGRPDFARGNDQPRSFRSDAPPRREDGARPFRSDAPPRREDGGRPFRSDAPPRQEGGGRPFRSDAPPNRDSFGGGSKFGGGPKRTFGPKPFRDETRAGLRPERPASPEGREKPAESREKPRPKKAADAPARKFKGKPRG